ncbi:MAG TPA: hypothetical protein VK137_06595, partial [Planctomycetaceae bacterium]|nr:hypothetical protein [Planctomycetaceae bacterium]
SNWSWAFDPIALRIGTDEKRLSADLSVMPLIARSEYRDMMRIATGVALKSDAGDPHDAVAHVILALNRESDPIQQANRFLAQALVGNQAAGLGADKPLDPLGWLGQSIAVYADRDPYWLDLAKLDRQERRRKLQQDGYRLPFALRIEVQQPLKLALFLTAVKTTIQQAAPNLTRWDTQTHREQQYVKIAPARRNAVGVPDLDNFALYYGIIGDGLVFTPNEEVLKRAIDRQLARDGQLADTKQPDAANATTSAAAPGWLGESVAVRFDGEVPLFLVNLDETDHRQLAQNRSWSNLPILNEWKRRYPDLDPIEVHRRFWGVELVCPSGVRYVWNEQWRTMESPVFGHPGEPKLPDSPALLFPFAKASFGLTFELDGLRSRLELLRETK